MNKAAVFFVFMMLPAILTFSEAYIPKVGVVGTATYKDSLVEDLSKLYELVPVEKKDYQFILKIWKEQDIGLRKKAIERTAQLPDIDYLIELSGNIVTFYDLSNATMKRITVGSKNPERSIIDFFQSFILLFKLPTFIDKTARLGCWYAILDKHGDVIGYYQNKTASNTITIPASIFKGATYARKLRKALIHNEKVIYEISEKDLNLQINDPEHFKVFRDGQEVSIEVFIQKGGFLYILDIYKDDIICVKSEPVTKGKYTFTFTAYKEDENVKETLIFVLNSLPIENCDNLSFEYLKRILCEADGVDLITFVVK